MERGVWVTPPLVHLQPQRGFGDTRTSDFCEQHFGYGELEQTRVASTDVELMFPRDPKLLPAKLVLT